jgi:hypothetical protein
MLSPEVTNALFRVERVSDPAPAPFEHHTHETGDFWIYELLGYESTSLEEWTENIIPKLKLLIPILADYPNTVRFIHVKTEVPCSPYSSQISLFDSRIVEISHLCAATIEHCVLVQDKE